MKKFFLMPAVCFICSAAVFAKDINPMPFETNPLGWNSDIKLSLYAGSQTRAENNKWPAFILNLIVGWVAVGGIGSYVQGDIAGGTIGLTGSLAGWGLTLGGIFMSQRNTQLAMIISGSALRIGIWIFGLVRPFTYANKVRFAFAPGINGEGKPEFTSYVSFKY